MPIYEYKCQACGAALEKLQKISDPVLVECPECGKESLVKLVSASSFRLKGGGWYESDFKTGKKKNGVGDSEDAAVSDKTGEAGSSAESPKTGAKAGSANAENSKADGQAVSATAGKKEDAVKSVKENSSNKPGGSGSPSAAV